MSVDAMAAGDDGWDYGLFRTNLELGAFDSDLLIEQREIARIGRHLLHRIEAQEGRLRCAREWTMENEIAGVPLDWKMLGSILNPLDTECPA